MTTQANIDSQVNRTTAEQVCDYLGDNPAFFDDHPDLLAELNLSHSSGAAVSLIERQIQILRDRNADLKAKLLELVDVARENDRLNDRMHQMTLDLLKIRSLVELLDALEDHLRNEFKADAIAVHMTGLSEDQQRETTARRLEVNETLTQLFQPAFTEGKPQCGRLKREQLDVLFGDQAAAIESAAIIPLGKNAERGLLAIGSREVNRFNPCMGTLFLSHLGELLGGLLEHRDTSA